MSRPINAYRERALLAVKVIQQRLNNLVDHADTLDRPSKAIEIAEDAVAVATFVANGFSIPDHFFPESQKPAKPTKSVKRPPPVSLDPGRPIKKPKTELKISQPIAPPLPLPGATDVASHDHTLPKGKPLGLVNVGQYCYGNSTVQALNAAIDIKRFISELGQEHIGPPSKIKWDSTKEFNAYYDSITGKRATVFNPASDFTSLLKDLQAPPLKRNRSTKYHPYTFQSTFSRITSEETHEWNGLDQQDSSEYYRKIIHCLAAGHQYPKEPSKPNSVIDSTFKVTNHFESKCVQEACGYTWKSGRNADTDWLLSLELPEDLRNEYTTHVSIDDFLEHRAVEDVISDFKCEKCYNETTDLRGCTRTWRGLVDKPKVLATLFDRRGAQINPDDFESFYKLQYNVVLPEVLDAKWSGSDKRYNLRTVIKHMGDRFKSGHYVAYTKTDEGWWLCNDSRVSQATFLDVLESSGQAYMAFYQLVDLPSKGTSGSKSRKRKRAETKDLS